MAQAFEHGSGFAQGEVEGGIRLGTYQAYYEEIFAEIIEDGVITVDERARLDRAADALGLDKLRLRRLEAALATAYEARHRVKVREAGAPLDVASEAARAPAPLGAPDGTGDQTLHNRVAWLEARVKQLEAELASAHAHVPVELDLSALGGPAARATLDAISPTAATGALGTTGATALDDDPADLLRRVRQDPRNPALHHALFRAWTRAGEEDRRFCAAHVLVFLGEADEQERAIYHAHDARALPRPRTSLTTDAWRRLLFHPEEEVLTGDIFSVIVPAVLLGRVSALRRDGALPALDRERRQDPAQSTLQAVRCFSWAAAILGMTPPPLYVHPERDLAVEMVPGVPPSTRLGQRALTGRSPLELAFLAGRHLSFYREEHFVRLLLPSIADLEVLFLAALQIGNPRLPLDAATRRRTQPLAEAIEPMLDAAQIDRLRGAFLRFVEEGGRTNLARWVSAADRTACRAGLLLADDLSAAHIMLEGDEEKMDDLLVFACSDRYSALRKQLQIAL